MTQLRFIPSLFVLILFLLNLQVSSAQDSLNVRRLGRIALPNPWAVTVRGNYAYVATDSGLSIVGIADPSNPIQISNIRLPARAMGVALSGNYAYVADFTSGLRIIDISNLEAPTEVGFYSTPSGAEDVAINGEYAYVADYYSGFRIINISNPAEPQPVGFYDTPGEACDVVISGNYAYIADWLSGLRIIDISNPEAPTEVGSYATLSAARNLSVVGNYAYVANCGDGLRIIDVSNPAAPTQVVFFTIPNNSYWNIAMSGNLLFIADVTNGLQVINVSNPERPYRVGFYNFRYSCGVTAVGNIAYVTTWHDGSPSQYLDIFDCSQALGVVDRVGESVPTTFTLKPNYPNPFNATTSIRYAIAKSGKVDLRVFDVTGKEVAKLVNFEQDPGEYSFTFDGKSLATGTYLVRLTAGNFTQTQKIVLLK